jgi:hypothetical protein
MAETRTNVVAIRTEPARTWLVETTQAFGEAVAQAGAWAGQIAQQFAAVVSALLGPAVFCAYAVAIWSLAANLGWTDTFVFNSGPLSNWLIWLGCAVLVNVAASVLNKHTRVERNR